MHSHGDPPAGGNAPSGHSADKRMETCQQPWDQLTDDAWTHIIEHLDFHTKLSMQKTCRRLHNMLANPVAPQTWGRLTVSAPKFNTSANMWQICAWVQRRLKGISALRYNHKHADDLPMMWHALVATTSGTGVRLRLASEFLQFAPASVLRPPAHSELVQRLTALDICVAYMDDVAAVHMLASLRQLQMTCSTGSDLQPWDDNHLDAANVCQLTRLHTLQLVRMPPDVFFLPGTAARLQQLRALRLHECLLLEDNGLPAEMLRLPALSRLQLEQMPLYVMPDLRRLPALQALVMSGAGGMPTLDATQTVCSPELKAALRNNPLGGAMGLIEAVLCDIPVVTQECAEAIERLPNLRLLGLDYTVCEEGAFWAAKLQQRMHGRCNVQPAPTKLAGACSPFVPWVIDDW